MKSLKICLAASEVAPFAKTGGLADVAGALPVYLQQAGHDVRLFMPHYAQIDSAEYDLVPVDFLQGVPIQLGSNRFSIFVSTGKMPGSDLDVYFIGCPQLYHRPGIYTGEWDEHLRFAVLSAATLECCQRMGFSPDIVHANDWHTALLPIYLKTLYSWDQQRFGHTKTILTIHNIAYQGIFPSEVVGNLGLEPYSGLLYQEDLAKGMVNFLKTGLLYTDVISTVSPTYAQEIRTETFGEGLEGLLRERSASVVGILNGVDYTSWNPQEDAYIAQQYGPDDVAEGKRANRDHLLKQMGLPPAGDNVPVLGIVSRLVAQKGFELTMEALPDALRYLDMRFVVLGTGESRFEEHFQWLQKAFPQKVCYYRGYSEKLAHMIEAGADIFIMPSRFEPCGLNQMYSLKYGTPPLVRKTGGLADTVEHWREPAGEGTGFVFEHYDSTGFAWALKEALTAYKNPEGWAQLRQNGMAKDYSWERQAAEYEKLFLALTS